MSHNTENVTDLDDDTLDLAAGAGLNSWLEAAQAGMMSQQPKAQGLATYMADDKSQHEAIRAI